MSCAEGTSGAAPYYDVALEVCATGCSDDAPIRGSDHVCRPCPEAAPYWNKESCVRCADAFPGTKEFWDPLFRECVAECPAGREAVDDLHICRTCAQVDSEKPYWDARNLKCVACLRGTSGDFCLACDEYDPNAPVWDAVHKRCASCTAAFGEERPIWDPNTRECVAACPAGTTLIEDANAATRWCQTCA